MGPWLPFCENVANIWLYEKIRGKRQRWDGFLLMAEWSCESLIFLPKPFVIWSSCSCLPSCHCPQTPGIIIMSNSVLFPASGISSPHLCLSNLLQDHPAHTPFLQMGPHSHVKPPSAIPDGESVLSLGCLWSCVCTTIRATIFCGVWWIFTSA